ncbi:MAG TPA: HypC/HybG/HupF family hydrogenase formation chaperone [Verrucomicrobiae bacterium]|nr:HypC/HybG/HupF family hydrogenase formation chaperone [Verrucomicrobiae bacterium]
MCLAIPGQIVSFDPALAHSATVDVVGVRRKVDISLVEPEGVSLGDWVLIHVGFAMSKIREQDAHDQMRMLRSLGETQAAMDEVRGYLDDVSEGKGGSPP